MSRFRLVVPVALGRLGRVLGLGALLALGCTQSTTAKPAAAPSDPVTATAADSPELSDQEFGPAVVRLLLGQVAGAERAQLLGGAVGRQMSRARAYFAKGDDAVGLRALRGGLYLARSNELTPSALGQYADVLQKAAEALARTGDEGKAEAMYRLLLESQEDTNSATYQSALKHLNALSRWQQDTRRPGSMQARGEAQRAALHRALLVPSRQSVQRARNELIAWVDHALVFGGEQSPPRSHFEQDERMESYRALRTAALTGVALYLRAGDVTGALSLLEEESLSRVRGPALVAHVEQADEARDPRAWAGLFQLFDSAPEADTLPMDEEVATAAAFAAAVELLRAAPEEPTAAMPLATLVGSHGMDEVAPLLLARSLSPSTPADRTSWMLGLLLQSLSQLEALGDLATARRTFQYAAPLLEHAQRPELRSAVKPSSGFVHYQMGAIEARAGELDRARPHLQRAVAEETRPEALRLLASIERQRGNLDSALESLDQLLADDNALTPGGRAETLLLRFELLRDQGQAAAASESLAKAMQLALRARSSAQTQPDLAYAERVVARVLEHYGEREAARRAAERAFEASRNDVRQMTQSVLDSCRRALTFGDLRSARQAVQHAMSSDLADEDTVYAALWLKLLEQRVGASGDGTVQEALTNIDSKEGWVGSLTAWGLGRISNQQLLQRASNRTEQVEAQFYVAMVQPEKQQALKQLTQVANSSAIQLVEVTIARDLLTAQRNLPKPTLPERIELP